MLLPICLIIFGVCALGAAITNIINLVIEMWKMQTSIILKTNQGQKVESFHLKVSGLSCLFMTYLLATGLAAIIVGAVLLM